MGEDLVDAQQEQTGDLLLSGLETNSKIDTITKLIQRGFKKLTETMTKELNCLKREMVMLKDEKAKLRDLVSRITGHKSIIPMNESSTTLSDALKENPLREVLMKGRQLELKKNQTNHNLIVLKILGQVLPQERGK